MNVLPMGAAAMSCVPIAAALISRWGGASRTRGWAIGLCALLIAFVITIIRTRHLGDQYWARFALTQPPEGDPLARHLALWRATLVSTPFVAFAWSLVAALRGVRPARLASLLLGFSCLFWALVLMQAILADALAGFVAVPA
jgi:hypothetical protein